jgi:hypothetical protein
MTDAARNQLTRPFYLLVVFWGELHRGHVARLLLPSLLAPGNAPAIRHIEGSRLLLCTTKQDWDELEKMSAFRELKQFIELELIEIPFPPPNVGKYLHSGNAFKLAVERCWNDGANATFLAPDVILSDGALAYASKVTGAEAVLVPAVRYESDGCLAALAKRNLLVEGRPIVASARELAAIGVENLHSEIRRYEWSAPWFCRDANSMWWRLRGSSDLLFHTTSWLMLRVNFGALKELNAGSLDHMAHDAVFINDNFFRFRETGQLHFITDSDDVFVLSTTDEAEFSYYPIRTPWLNRIPVVGSLVKTWTTRLYFATANFDPFRRWAITIPTFLHGAPLPENARELSLRTSAVVRRAVKPPNRILALYGSIPPRRLLWSYVDLLFREPEQFLVKLLRRVTGRRGVQRS